MVDDIKSPSSDLPEQYNVAGESETTNYGAENADYTASNTDTEIPRKSGLMGGNMKRVLLPLGLIVAVLVLYHVLGWINKSKQERAVQPEVTQEMTTAKIAPSVSATSAVVTPITQPTTSSNDAANQQMDAVKTQLSANQDQLNKFSDGLKNNQDAINDLNKSLSSLSASVDTLSKNLNKFIADSKKPKVIKKVVPVPHIAYRIKAIVPGRAWLEDPTGQVLSVKVGDMVNGAPIELISPKQNLIITSSGEIIQYGATNL